MRGGQSDRLGICLRRPGSVVGSWDVCVWGAVPSSWLEGVVGKEECGCPEPTPCPWASGLVGLGALGALAALKGGSSPSRGLHELPHL